MTSTTRLRGVLAESLKGHVALPVSLIAIGLVCAHLIDFYQIRRYPPLPMGKYEEMAVWSDLYNRWVAVTPPDYAKVFLPTSGY